MPFMNRWRINGVLSTTTPLHIGDGTVTTRDDLVVMDKVANESKMAEISAVATDHNCRAYIPGKALKGNLRSWVRTNLVSSSALSKAIDTVFGSEDPDDPDAVGGKAEFQDAVAVIPPHDHIQVPYRDSGRLTGVRASVAIDRLTQTAMPNKLFYQEIVPPGVSFNVTITGQDMEPTELYLLLVALEGFNAPKKPVIIGAGTSDSQGHLTWKLRDIARMGKEDVSAWLEQKDTKKVGYAALTSLSQAEIDEIIACAEKTFTWAHPPCIVISGNIHFEGPFLVNDPSRTRKDKDSPSQEGIPDHTPLLDDKGLVYLPSSSLRGAVRSQAERIVRTLKPDAACLSTDSNMMCAPIYESTNREHLCLVCQAFGAAGWHSPIEFSDFHLQEESKETPFEQDFVAIDRFTGGAANQAKFDARAIFQPVLTGSMTIDLLKAEPWVLGLLALTLRDFMEGDISLGFGATKGYGACRLEITGLQVYGIDKTLNYENILKQNEVTLDSINNLDVRAVPDTGIQAVLTNLVQAFHKMTADFRKDSGKGGHDG